jgi:hypothetical protein
VACRNRAGLTLRSLTTTAIQAGEDRDRETSIEIHRPLDQHGALAFVARLHGAPPYQVDGDETIRQK